MIQFRLYEIYRATECVLIVGVTIDILHFISRDNQDIQASNTYTMLDLATRPHNHLGILCLCLASLQWVIRHLNQVTLRLMHQQGTLNLVQGTLNLAQDILNLVRGTRNLAQAILNQTQGILNLVQGTLNLTQATLNLGLGTHQQGIPSPLALKGIHNQILLKAMLNMLKQGTLKQGTHRIVKGTHLLASTRGTLQVINKPKARHTMSLRDIFPQLRYVIKGSLLLLFY